MRLLFAFPAKAKGKMQSFTPSPEVDIPQRCDSRTPYDKDGVCQARPTCPVFEFPKCDHRPFIAASCSWWWCSSPSWCSVTLLNSSNGSAISLPGVAKPESNGTPLTLLAPRSTLALSFTLRKLTVSIARPWWGIMGGFMWRRRAHWVARKKGWVFTSEAPARDPRRRISSLIRSFRISDLQRLESILAIPELLCQMCLDILWDLGSTRCFRKRHLISKDIGKCSVSVLAFEWSGSEKHFVYQDT